jgi:hypothetical protein
VCTCGAHMRNMSKRGCRVHLREERREEEHVVCNCRSAEGKLGGGRINNE